MPLRGFDLIVVSREVNSRGGVWSRVPDLKNQCLERTTIARLAEEPPEGVSWASPPGAACTCRDSSMPNLGSNLHDSGEGSVHCKSRSCSILTRSTSRMSGCEDKNLRDRAVALSGPLCIYTSFGKGNLDRSRQMLGREAEMAAASRRRGMLEANTSRSS